MHLGMTTPQEPRTPTAGVSAFHDFGVRAADLSWQQRMDNLEITMQRYFVGHGCPADFEHEAVVRNTGPGPDFPRRLREAEELAAGGFGPELRPPSKQVTRAFAEYALSDLGAVALARLVAWDEQFIRRGWRNKDGSLTDEGIRAWGAGHWRPFRVASSGDGPDTVTPSGLLVLPDHFVRERYTTGDVADPLAIIHHELKAHVLPLREARGLSPGRRMELICVRLESEMLVESGLPPRRLNWGKDDGFLDHTLHEESEQYFHGLVRYVEGELLEFDPQSGTPLGPARPEQA